MNESGINSGAEWVLAIPFAVLGVAAMVAGGVMLKHRIAALLRGRLVDAEVVDRDAHRVPVAAKRAPGGADHSTVTPHFRYRGADREERTARLDHQARQRLRSQGNRLRYPLGARVRVRIDTARPDIAYDDWRGAMLVFPALLLLAGVLMTLLALGIYFGARG